MQYSGTPAYMSPELFQKRQYDEKVDVFAFGTLFWEVLSREVPYDGLDPIDIRSKVEKEEPLKSVGNPTLNQLISECRQVNFQERPTFERILEIISMLVPK
jgi:sterile alpha motif and leucine zipper containing kinase AZK